MPPVPPLSGSSLWPGERLDRFLELSDGVVVPIGLHEDASVPQLELVVGGVRFDPSLVLLDPEYGELALFLLQLFLQLGRGSLAVVGGGVRCARYVVWHQVGEDELRPPVDPRTLFAQRLRERGLDGAVGLLTVQQLQSYQDTRATYGSLSARCIATVGLGNALRVSDPPDATAPTGTVNLLCCTSVPLSVEALLESMSLAAEARTVAIWEAETESGESGRRASGTGTDCIVMAAPMGHPVHRYGGKHTAIGHVVGTAVERAVAQGVLAWKKERTGSLGDGL